MTDDATIINPDEPRKPRKLRPSDFPPEETDEVTEELRAAHEQAEENEDG